MFGLKKRKKRCPLSTLIGAGTLIDGDLTYTGGLHVDGTVLGDILPENVDQRSEACIGETGIVKGSVRGTNVIVHGTVDGDVFATESVTIGAKAHIAGDVIYTELSVDGCSAVTGRFIPNGMLEGTPPSAGASRDGKKPARYNDLMQLMRRPRS